MSSFEQGSFSGGAAREDRVGSPMIPLGPRESEALRKALERVMLKKAIAEAEERKTEGKKAEDSYDLPTPTDLLDQEKTKEWRRKNLM